MKAFLGPLALKERLGAIDAETLASADLEPVFFAKPVIHRYPRSMAKRVHELAVHVRDRYGGDAARRLDRRVERRGAPRNLRGSGLRRDEDRVDRSGPVQALRGGGGPRAVPPHPTLGDVDSPQALEDYQAAKTVNKAEWAKAHAAGARAGHSANSGALKPASMLIRYILLRCFQMSARSAQHGTMDEPPSAWAVIA